MIRRLRAMGVLGINRRNARYTLKWNDRRFYPLVDDKLATKRLCEEAGIPVPKLLAVADIHHDARELPRRMAGHADFVLKPSRGAMGNGILVLRARPEGGYVRTSGRVVSPEDLAYHAAGIISGLYSLAGHKDVAMVEERIVTHPDLDRVSSRGVPDVRVIVYRGFPVMAMIRLPTDASAGRANLHQGAIGAGIDLGSGATVAAVLRNRPVHVHPDKGLDVVGFRIPDFESVLRIAVSATDRTGLRYVGADVVVDACRGPVILELNARPGLAIQIANRAGLLPRLDAVDARLGHSDPGRPVPDVPLEERVAAGRDIAARHVARAA